jgi:cell division protein FtsW (lipid II flippase)
MKTSYLGRDSKMNRKRAFLLALFVAFEILSILSALLLYSTDWRRELSGGDTFVKIVLAASLFLSLVAALAIKRIHSAPMWIALFTCLGAFLVLSVS